MDERVRFVARLLDAEKMAPLCAEFGISRKTGYKLYDRDKNSGAEGLTDRRRWPFRQALGAVKPAAESPLRPSSSAAYPT